MSDTCHMSLDPCGSFFLKYQQYRQGFDVLKSLSPVCLDDICVSFCIVLLKGANALYPTTPWNFPCRQWLTPCNVSIFAKLILIWPSEMTVPVATLASSIGEADLILWWCIPNNCWFVIAIVHMTQHETLVFNIFKSGLIFVLVSIITPPETSEAEINLSFRNFLSLTISLRFYNKRVEGELGSHCSMRDTIESPGHILNRIKFISKIINLICQLKNTFYFMI